MIPDIFLSVVYWIVAGIIGWFPLSSGFGPGTIQAASTIGGYGGIFAPLVNYAVLGGCVAVVFAVEMGVYGFRTLKWIISHIPFIGGKG